MAAPSQRTAGAPATHPRVRFDEAANQKCVLGFGRSTQADQTDKNALGLHNLLRARAILVTKKHNKKEVFFFAHCYSKPNFPVSESMKLEPFSSFGNC